MGKCHGVTMVQGIVKHLVRYMAAAQEDNRLISWLSEPYRTILLFPSPFQFLLDIRLTLIHTFTVHTVNSFSCRYTLTHINTHALAIFSFEIYFATLGKCRRLEGAGGRESREIPKISVWIFKLSFLVGTGSPAKHVKPFSPLLPSTYLSSVPWRT